MTTTQSFSEVILELYPSHDIKKLSTLINTIQKEELELGSAQGLSEGKKASVNDDNSESKKEVNQSIQRVQEALEKLFNDSDVKISSRPTKVGGWIRESPIIQICHNDHTHKLSKGTYILIYFEDEKIKLSLTQGYSGIASESFNGNKTLAQNVLASFSNYIRSELKDDIKNHLKGFNGPESLGSVAIIEKFISPSSILQLTNDIQSLVKFYLENLTKFEYSNSMITKYQTDRNARKSEAKRKQIEETMVKLFELSNLTPSFVNWIDKENLYNIEEQVRTENGGIADILLQSKKDKNIKILCELKWVEFNEGHEMRRKIRVAIGQLLEYAYFLDSLKETCPCFWIVLNKKPSVEMIEYLLNIKKSYAIPLECYVKIQEQDAYENILAQ